MVYRLKCMNTERLMSKDVRVSSWPVTRYFQIFISIKRILISHKASCEQISCRAHSSWGKEISSNSVVHMAFIAAMFIYGKKPLKILFSGTNWLMAVNTGMKHWLLKCYKNCSNCVHVLILTFKARRNFGKKQEHSISWKVLKWFGL